MDHDLGRCDRPYYSCSNNTLSDDKKERTAGKIKIFKILMATRAQNLSPGHVEALNMIDLEFDGQNKRENKVISAWKSYLDHLGDGSLSPDVWASKRADLFVDLLHSMATVLGFKFDKIHIRRSVYSPKAHGKIERRLDRNKAWIPQPMEGKDCHTRCMLLIFTRQATMAKLRQKMSLNNEQKSKRSLRR